jgi:hypothetical protein
LLPCRDLLQPPIRPTHAPINVYNAGEMTRFRLLAALLGVLLSACGASTPAETPTPAGYPHCYYVWATRELPELSEKFDRALQAIDRAASGSAYAFGEDCVYEDGHRDFGTMETDFRVVVLVNSLEDEHKLGSWIMAAMQTINDLPPGEIPGPQPGRAEFTFEKNKAEELRLQVPIAEYRALPPGLSPDEIFRRFHINP